MELSSLKKTSLSTVNDKTYYKAPKHNESKTIKNKAPLNDYKLVKLLFVYPTPQNIPPNISPCCIA